MLPERPLVCRVAGLDAVTHDILRLSLAIETGGPFRFSAGQYAALRFADFAPRDYSMANRPDEEMLEFHIRRMGAASASAYVADGLRLGERVILTGPFGVSYLRDQHAGTIIAVAGGSGLAPIKSIVETALDRGRTAALHLYFGAREERDVYLEERFRALAARHGNLRYSVVLSAPGPASRHRSGFVHDALAADLGGLDGAKAYLAGPPAMVEAAAAVLRARGLAAEDVHADPFYGEEEKTRRTMDPEGT